MATSLRPLHLAPHQIDLELKAKARTELTADVDAWLASGGKIQHLNHGDRAPEVPVKRRGKAAKKADPAFTSKTDGVTRYTQKRQVMAPATATPAPYTEAEFEAEATESIEDEEFA